MIRSCRTFAQTERHALLVLPELQPAAVCEGFRFAHPFSADGHEQLRVGPVEHVDVDLVAPAGRDAPCARRHGPGLRAVDRLAVLPQPGADSREAFQSRRGQRPVGLRADIEQQVPSASRSPREVADEFVRRFVAPVRDPVSPRAVHRLARFERQAAHGLPRESRRVLARQVAFEGLHVLALERREVVVVHHQAGRLQRVDQSVQFVQAPVEPGIFVLVPHAVEPDCPHRAVLREQLGELRLHEVEIGLRILLFGRTSRAAPRAAARGVLPPPVDERIVEMDAQTLPAALFGQLLHHVASERRGVRDVVGRLRRAEHRESVVVARREADVAGSCLAEGRHPRLCVECRRTERPGELLVFVVVDVLVGHHPFALSEQGVETPVEEDAEPSIGESLPCGEVLGRRLVGGLCGRVRGEQRGAAAKQQFFHGVFRVEVSKYSENFRNFRMPPPAASC